MFEQSLYDQEPIREPQSETIVEPVREGDLFGTYEIKSWSLSPRLYKILGASAAVNIVALLVFAQTSVLTMKGCDSPLVGSVCQVLDTVYVGAMLFGTEREYVDADYEKTELGEATIVYTELPPENEKLHYPADYFQIANPIEYQASLDALNNDGMPPGYLAPGIPGNSGMPAGYPPPHTSGSSIFDTPARTPKRNNNVTDLSKLPGGIEDVSAADPNPIAKVRTPKGPRKPPSLNPNGTEFPGAVKPAIDPTTQAATDPEAEAKPDQFGVYINKRPIKDKAKDTVAKVEANEIKLDAAFKVTISGTLGLGKDGNTIVLKKPVQVKDGTQNDPKMEKLVSDWIIAVGDAGWYGYALKLDDKKKLKDRKVVITVEQSDTDFFASIRTEQLDENSAKTLSSGLIGTLGIAGLTADGDIKEFLKSASPSADGKTLVLNVRLPKTQVQEMITRKLAEEKAKPTQPNSNAIFRPGDNSAIK